METETTVPVCPFCGGPPLPLALPGADAFGCNQCGAIGPAETGEPGPDRFQRAIKSWSKRGGVGNVRVAHVAANITPATAAVSENLLKTSEKILANEFGPVDCSHLLLCDSKTRRVGVIRHALDDAGSKWLLEQILTAMNQKQAVAAAGSGLILPPGARTS